MPVSWVQALENASCALQLFYQLLVDVLLQVVDEQHHVHSASLGLDQPLQGVGARDLVVHRVGHHPNVHLVISAKHRERTSALSIFFQSFLSHKSPSYY